MSNLTAAPKPFRQRGVTLVELMVAIVVTLILLAGLIQVYLSSKQGYNAQEQLSRMQESGRLAMDLITTDLRRAGYWGGNANLSLVTGNPGPIQLASHSHTCTPGSNTWGRMIVWRVAGLNQDAAPGGYTCATGHIAGTDILTVRYARPEVLDQAEIPANDGLYLRSTMFRGRITTGALIGDSANEIPPEDPESAFAHLMPTVRQVVSNAYYVGDSGRTCPGGQAIPSLRRVRLDPATGFPITEEIASGAEQLQVRYLFGGDYVDASAVTAANGWQDVQAVRVWLLVRGECPEQGLTNNTTYVMGDTTLTVNDNYRRQLYVSTVMLRNTVVRFF